MNKSISIRKSILFFSFLVFVLSSCSKDDTVNPEYVGTWSATMVSSGMQIKDNMTFTKDGFSEVGQLYNASTSKWINYMKSTGSISINGTTMTVTYKGIGISAVDPISGYPTGSIIMYGSSSTEFQSILSSSGQAITFDSKFSVSGNKLTLMTDNNGNGIYTDPGETTEYTKQ
jgi:hypothetical protein